MKQTIIALAIIATSSTAMADIDLPKQSKSDFGVHIGVATLMGDLGNTADYFNDDSNGISFGLDFTTQEGIIVGITHTPELVSSTAYIFGIQEGKTEVDLTSTSLYAGYQFDSGLRLTGGFTHSKAEAELTYLGYSDSESSMGLNAGLGYRAKYGIYADVRLATMEILQLNGVSATAAIGYKF